MENDTSFESGLSAAPAVSLSESDALLWEAIPALMLNIAQTAALCGISVRQLGYWTKQGYVTAAGRGSRRLYGPDSLRRILAIRKTMLAGSSLRQSLRSLSASSEQPAGSRVRGRERLAMESAASSAGAGSSLSPDAAEMLAEGLLALFNHNHYTRDNAVGLAIKMGRSEEDVRAIAEQLCRSGILTKTLVQGDAVFGRTEGSAKR